MSKQIPYRIVIHCTATPNGEEYSAAQIRKDHLARGWADIGYHVILAPDGQVERGRSLTEKGAGVEGANEGSIHICLVGTDRFTEQQFMRLREQLDAISTLYNIKPWDIFTHREFPSAIKQGKQCPNIRTGVLVAWYCGHYESAIRPYICKPL